MIRQLKWLFLQMMGFSKVPYQLGSIAGPRFLETLLWRYRSELNHELPYPAGPLRAAGSRNLQQHIRPRRPNSIVPFRNSGLKSMYGVVFWTQIHNGTLAGPFGRQGTTKREVLYPSPTFRCRKIGVADNIVDSRTMLRRDLGFEVWDYVVSLTRALI